MRALVALLLLLGASWTFAAKPLDEKGLRAFVEKNVDTVIERSQFETEEEHHRRLARLERSFVVRHESLESPDKPAYRYDRDTQTLTLFLRTHVVDHDDLFAWSLGVRYLIFPVSWNQRERQYAGTNRMGAVVAVTETKTSLNAVVLFGTDAENRGQPLGSVHVQVPSKEAEALAKRAVWRLHGKTLYDFPGKRDAYEAGGWSVRVAQRFRPTFDSPTDDQWHATYVPGMLHRAEAVDPRTGRVLGTLDFE